MKLKRETATIRVCSPHYTEGYDYAVGGSKCSDEFKDWIRNQNSLSISFLSPVLKRFLESLGCTVEKGEVQLPKKTVLKDYVFKVLRFQAKKDKMKIVAIANKMIKKGFDPIEALFIASFYKENNLANRIPGHNYIHFTSVLGGRDGVNASSALEISRKSVASSFPKQFPSLLKLSRKNVDTYYHEKIFGSGYGVRKRDVTVKYFMNKRQQYMDAIAKGDYKEAKQTLKYFM